MRRYPQQHFYPRSPCGERHIAHKGMIFDYPISIHALLAESDRDIAQKRIKRLSFLSTLSLRRATGKLPKPLTDCVISIHALLAESDRLFRQNLPPILIFLSTLSLRRATLRTNIKIVGILHFYPRSPCGERLPVSGGNLQSTHFYPRSPCGERPAIGK